MREDPSGELCRACGLCCDGSLFGRVDLEPTEVASARKRGLLVLPSGKSFEQPCAALAPSSGAVRSCAIYSARPMSCRRFTCRLNDGYERDGGPLEPRLDVVRRARAMLDSVRASRAEGREDDAGTAELTRWLDEHFAPARPRDA